MASEWFIIRDGKRHGPYSSAQIKGLAEQGKVRDTDLLWKEGMEQPRPAGQANGLVRARAKPATAKLDAAASQADDTNTAPSQAYTALKEGAKSAARMASLAAERAKIVTLTLPAFYRELGKSGYQHREMCDVCGDTFSQLDALAPVVESSHTDSASITAATTISGKAKALAAKGIELAKHKQASIQQGLLFAELGKAIYEKADLASAETRSRYGAISERISECLRRLEEIDEAKNAAVGTPGHAVGVPSSPTLRVARFAGVGLAVSGVLLSACWMLYRPSTMKRPVQQAVNTQPPLPSGSQTLANPTVPSLDTTAGDMTSRLNSLIKPRMSARDEADKSQERSKATVGNTAATPQQTVAAPRQFTTTKEQPPASRAGTLSTFTPKTRENFIGIQLVQLPAGTFTMAEDPYNPPGVAVELTHGFWIGKHEVTQKQWATVRQRQPALGEAVDREQRAMRGDDLPAVAVDWFSAKAFCEALTTLAREEGEITQDQCYRLPTDAEWEYACRAGTNTPYCFGKEARLLPEHAWFYDNTLDKGMKHPRPVGLKKPNAWGLCDTHGNVKEWCADGYRKALPGGRDPFVEPVRGGKVVARGGSWRESAHFVQSWFRAEEDPENSSIDYGFRVVLDDNKTPATVTDQVTDAPRIPPPPMALAPDETPATVSVPEPATFVQVQGAVAAASALLRGERSLNAFDLSQVVGADANALTLLQGEEVTLYGVVGVVGTQHSAGEKDTTLITFVGPNKYTVQCKLPKLETKAEWLLDHKAVIRGRIAGSREVQGLQGKQEYLVLDGCRVLEPDLGLLPERPSVVGMSREEKAAYAETLLSPDRRTVGQVLWSLRRLQSSGSIFPTEGNKQDTIDEALNAFGGGVGYALPAKGIPLTYSFDGESVAGRVKIPTQKWESTFGERRELKVLRNDIDVTETYKQALDRYIDPDKLATAKGLVIDSGWYYTPSEALTLRFWETECQDGDVLFNAETTELPQLGLTLQIKTIGVRMKESKK